MKTGYLSQIYPANDRDGLQIWMFVAVYIPHFLSNDSRCSLDFTFSDALSPIALFSSLWVICSCFGNYQNHYILDARYFEFYLVEGWIFLYFYKYHWALLKHKSSYFQMVRSFWIWWDQSSLQTRSIIFSAITGMKFEIEPHRQRARREQTKRQAIPDWQVQSF